MEEQRKVADFIEKHDLPGTTESFILDLASEVGEIAKEANESTNFGTRPEELDVRVDEIGDALFSLLALAESLDVDAGDALNAALEKYRRRLRETGSPSSQEGGTNASRHDE